MNRRSNRRQFIQQTGLAGIGFWVAGGLTQGARKDANGKLSIASIGVGGKGSSDVDGASKVGNIVALCDIDDNHLEGKAKKFPQAKKYNDFRKMFDEMGKSIDAVTVSTPDHTHAAASMLAIKLGKHVYTQKPLTHTVREARELREAARKHKVCTQMGNQGSASNGLREGVEVIQSGAIGPVREVHVWTNRPIWPQGTDAILRVDAARTAAFAALRGKTPADLPFGKAPKHVHWDLFLGPAPERPYASIYHPFSLARLVGLRHRRPGRHGLSHGQPGLPRPQARLPDQRLGRERRRQPGNLSDVGDHHLPVPRARRHAGGQVRLV